MNSTTTSISINIHPFLYPTYPLRCPLLYTPPVPTLFPTFIPGWDISVPLFEHKADLVEFIGEY